MSFGAHLRSFYSKHRLPADLVVVAQNTGDRREVETAKGSRWGFFFEHVLYIHVGEFAHSIGAEIVAVSRRNNQEIYPDFTLRLVSNPVPLVPGA